MVVKRQCSFCAREIEPGTGTMFVKRDGTVFHFCSSSCRKQQLDLGRVGHRFKWTRAHELKRASDRSTAQKAPAAAAKPGGARPSRRPSSAPAKVAPSAEPVPIPAGEATAAAPPDSPATAEAPASASAPKPRRPRKKAEAPAGEGSPP
jgi:large subunit ribosomal protein L24e